MSETFCFPGYGCPTEIAAVQIKPRWQTTQLEDSLRLMGIYHITAHVRFDFQDMRAFMDDEELVQIDNLDIQGDTGYFEYAVPLNVDLPMDAAIEDLMVKDIRPILTNQMCQLEWTVTSVFNEPELALEKAHVLETANASAQIEVDLAKETAQVKQPATVVASNQEEKTVAVTASVQEEKSTAVVASTQEEKSKIVTFAAQKEKSEAIVASDKKEKPAPVEQKTMLRESSSHIVVRESSSWHEVPSMIWDLTEDYTPLKVRVSNDFIQK
ncbi:MULTISPECIES: valyl-tRNA synthetase [unclassified Lysinibacillus]|uniref:valyl-tRNA synthetase n=1 Tax=unclassified Lysinibacillus TaxID=2636778 RepID=UPI0035DC8C6D